MSCLEGEHKEKEWMMLRSKKNRRDSESPESENTACYSQAKIEMRIKTNGVFYENTVQDDSNLLNKHKPGLLFTSSVQVGV